MEIAGLHWFWWVTWVPLLAFVVWSLFDGWFREPRGAARKFEAVRAALQRPVTQDSDFVSSLTWPVDDRVLAVKSGYFGSGGIQEVRGPRGYLFVVATPLRAPAWAMHDLEVRQRRSRGDWSRRFRCVESGVPVRDGWLTDAVRGAVTHFFDHPLAVGRLRNDRGELQHVASWSDVRDASDPAALRDVLARFAAVAAALDGTAGRRLPMD